MLSWYQIIHSEEYKEFMKKKEEIDQEDIDDGMCVQKSTLNMHKMTFSVDSTSSFEHTSSADPVRSRGHKGQLMSEREFFEEIGDN